MCNARRVHVAIDWLGVGYVASRFARNRAKEISIACPAISATGDELGDTFQRTVGARDQAFAEQIQLLDAESKNS